MKKAWQEIDLGGDGLQTLNARYTRLMRRRKVAYGAWLLFPLGAHRWYLKEPAGALAYSTLTAAAVGLGLGFGTLGFAVPAGLELAFAAFDLFWIERRRVALNKTLRMQQFMRPGAAPPRNYRGRYTDQDAGLDEYLALKERERAGHQPPQADAEAQPTRRAPSFNEQEALLRELSQRKKDAGKS